MSKNYALYMYMYDYITEVTGMLSDSNSKSSWLQEAIDTLTWEWQQEVSGGDTNLKTCSWLLKHVAMTGLHCPKSLYGLLQNIKRN